MGNIPIIGGKIRKTRTKSAPLVAGYWENIVKDAEGNILSRDWRPQLMNDGIKDAQGNEGLVPIVVHVPIEKHINNGSGINFYIEKGYKPLLEAERLLDELGIKYNKTARPNTAVAAAPVEQPAAAPKPANILKPKRGTPKPKV